MENALIFRTRRPPPLSVAIFLLWLWLLRTWWVEGHTLAERPVQKLTIMVIIFGLLGIRQARLSKVERGQAELHMTEWLKFCRIAGLLRAGSRLRRRKIS